MNLLHKSLLVGILILVSIYASIAFINQGGHTFVSGQIVGVPATCRAQFTVTGPESITIQPGGFGNVGIRLDVLACGLSSVKLALFDFPKEYYSVSPSYANVIPPKKFADFTIYFYIPPDVEQRTYSTHYLISSNEGVYTKATLEIDIKETEKPKSYIESKITTQSALEESESYKKSIFLWWTLAVIAVIIAIVVLTLERISFTTEPKKLPWKYFGMSDIEELIDIEKKQTIRKKRKKKT